MTQLPVARERPAPRARLPLTAAELAGWDAIIDARSPSEFAEDHLPGAVNCPVLDDAERALVGTAYKERGSFEAKRLGAPLVAANIARIVSERFADRPRSWRPLVYCWRGGSRSGSLTHVLRQVGWDAVQLDGGYKAFRRQVAADLETLPGRFTFRVVCGATGSGKSRLLEALATTPAQVLDLEALAAHRGSVLGEIPGAPQPSQKAFETAIWAALGGFDPRAAGVRGIRKQEGGQPAGAGGAHRAHARGRLPAAGGAARGAHRAPPRGLRAPGGRPAAAAREARLPRAAARPGTDRALETTWPAPATGTDWWRTSSRPTTTRPTGARCSATTPAPPRRACCRCARPPARPSSPSRAPSRSGARRGSVRPQCGFFRKVTTCMPGAFRVPQPSPPSCSSASCRMLITST